MSLVEYELRFYELYMLATIILSTKYKRIHCIIRGLRLLIHKATQSFVTLGESFTDIVEHFYTIEEMDYEA